MGPPQPAPRSGIVALLLVGSGVTLLALVLPGGRWTSIPVHAVIEAAGGVVSWLLGALLLAAPPTSEGARRRALAPGLVAMGTLDVLHAGCEPGELFVWLRGLSSLAGGVYFLLALAPGARRHLGALTWTAAVSAVSIGAASIAAPGWIPGMLVGGGFTATAGALNVSGGVGFVIAALVVARGQRERHASGVLGAMCLLFGLGAMLFPWSSLWDAPWWYWHGVRLGATALALVYVIGVHRRVQEALEEEIALRTRELRATVSDLETFSYSISHDLRAPLCAIEGYTALLLDLGQVSGDVRATLERVRAATRRMSELISDLLRLSQVSRQELTCVPVDLSALAGVVGAALAAQHPGRDVDLVVAPGLLTRGDPGFLRILLENLMGNAWKFTSKTTAPRVEVGREEQVGGTTFFVRDNGAGFDRRYADRLFVPFQRLHAQGDFPGTGIGLATARRVVERHGGTVSAEGAVGEGATIRFTLPA